MGAKRHHAAGDVTQQLLQLHLSGSHSPGQSATPANAGAASNLESNASILPRVSTLQSSGNDSKKSKESGERSFQQQHGSSSRRELVPRDTDSSSSASWTGDEIYYRPKSRIANPRRNGVIKNPTAAAVVAAKTIFHGQQRVAKRQNGGRSTFIQDMRRQELIQRVGNWLTMQPDMLSADPNAPEENDVFDDDMVVIAPLSFVETDHGGMRRMCRLWDDEERGRHVIDEDILAQKY
jgi:hypothetical protein